MDVGKKDLAAAVVEMRSVAARLIVWADDLEKSVSAVGPGAVSSVEEPEEVAVSSDVASSAVALAAPDVVAPAVAPAAPVSLAEVKVYLTKLCAAGYSAQVKALIASFGAASLSEVPADSLDALMVAARMLGLDGNGEDVHAG